MNLYDELKRRRGEPVEAPVPEAELVPPPGYEAPPVVQAEPMPLAAPAAPSPASERQRVMQELLNRYRGAYADEGALKAAQAEDERNGAIEGLGNQLSQTWFGIAGMKGPEAIHAPSRVQQLEQQRQAIAQQLGMEGAAQGWQRAEEEHPAKMGKLGLEAGKEAAGIRKTTAEAEVEAAKLRPAEPQLVALAQSLGIKVPEGINRQDLVALVDPWLRRQGIIVDQSRLAFDKTKGAGSASRAEEIADGIEQGLIQPPKNGRGLGKEGPEVLAILAGRKFNLARASLEWDATEKHVATLNGPQQVRVRQGASTVLEATDNIEKLYNEWTQAGFNSQYGAFNQAALQLAMQKGGRAGEVARALEMNIADLTEGLATVYMGGNTPTDNAIKLAQKNLASHWNEGQFREALKQVRLNISYRLHSISNVGVSGLGGDGSRYAAGAGHAEAPHAPSAPVQVASKAERDALPPGTKYTRPGDPTIYEKR